MFAATVLGFSLVLILCIVFFVFYLMVGLDSSSSIKVDPMPENQID
ncbi:hypothetical protein GCM10007425_28470 [Lysinibacillus alkalisoli]|uniref:Uncharacterized protein n=1 Tax=Lysinibacillus alkalisoli TaxID=1911548 RepID=A0A917LJL1_9BACI|nr:hypothetical protein GCM10007425_28470 [Lysinibacillus alkalisoli]